VLARLDERRTHAIDIVDLQK
jgi:hypothetical protein